MSRLERMIRWEYIERNGLHLLATPDTTKLMEEVRQKIQWMLDLAHSANESLYPQREVTTQTYSEYEMFASWDPIETLRESVRGKHVWTFSDPHGDFKKDELSINDKYAHDKLLLSAVRDNGAKTTNLVMSSFIGARQDKTTPRKRQPISVKQMAEELGRITGENGYIFVTDLHNPSSEANFRDTNLINFYTGWFVKKAIERAGFKEEDIILLPADEGGIKKIEGISKDIGCKSLKVIKTRDLETKNKVDEVTIIWDIEWKDIIIHDDILDTGGTLCNLLTELLKKNPKSITVCITHGMLNGKALQKVWEVMVNSQGKIKKIFISDSINKEDLPEWIEVIPTSNILANNITNIFQGFPVDRWDDNDYLKQVN